MNLKLRWRTAGQINRRSLPSPLRDLLFQSGSLTLYFEQHCAGKFTLELIRQSWQQPLYDEARVLGLQTGAWTWVREITLKCNDYPCVYGRSIIPARTLSGAERRLGYWGQRSLGDYLFSGRKVRRGRIEVAKILPEHRLFNLVTKNVAAAEKELWCRRSLFFIKNKPLLVVEIFLADVIQCMNSGKK